MVRTAGRGATSVRKISTRDRFRRLLAGLLRRRKVATSTLTAQLLGVTRVNLSSQFRDGHRILDPYRSAVAPISGSPARMLQQLQARLASAQNDPADQL